MARIEISLDEYNGLKQRINELEASIVEKNKKIEELGELAFEAKESLKMLINNTTWMERVFQWKKLVEVIKGENTPDEMVEKVKAIATEIGKTPVEVKEAPGFVVNRILIPMINEAVNVLDAGTASAEDIDVAMQLGASHPMGPLHLGDLIGLDICLAIMEVLYNETKDAKYAPAPLLKKMVEEKKLGKKTGIGFFDYSK